MRLIDLLTSKVFNGKLVISSSRSSSNPLSKLLLESICILFLEILSVFKFFIDNNVTGNDVKLFQLRSNTRTEVRFTTDSGITVEMLL